MKPFLGNPSSSSRRRRFLVIVNVFGSTGPMKFMVNGDDNVKAVVGKALRQYATEGRLPVLGNDSSGFHLFPSNAGFDLALNPSERIRFCGTRKFVMYGEKENMQQQQQMRETTTTRGKKWHPCLKIPSCRT